MLLLINPVYHDQLLVALVRATTIIAQRVGPVRLGEVEQLLPTVHREMRAERISTQQLAAVGVVTGPGRFSLLRTALATANTLGFALGIAVVGVPAERADTLENFLAAVLQALPKTAVGMPVAPAYGAEPNITLKSD